MQSGTTDTRRYRMALPAAALAALAALAVVGPGHANAADPAVQEYEQQLPEFSEDTSATGETGPVTRFTAPDRGDGSPVAALLTGLPAGIAILGAVGLLAAGSQLRRRGAGSGEPS